MGFAFRSVASSNVAVNHLVGFYRLTLKASCAVTRNVCAICPHAYTCSCGNAFSTNNCKS